MNPEQFLEQMKKIQEPKGYFFNKDMKMTMQLVESLLKNKERYGYMACPCRLAAGEYEQDKDIICPCIYREPDVEQYGSCFCGLYVAKEWNADEIAHAYVPERRPPEKILASLGI